MVTLEESKKYEMEGCKSGSFNNGEPAVLSEALAKMNYDMDSVRYQRIVWQNLMTGADLS